ncbi:zinc-binding dehydrogenase [Patulibacter minatonensis]|uniref:zinc-binding dehydrogenase n=1 Tax=Patulibacter minatonensis TaxID=298163 RepID=UPI00047B409A|nr:zinc-binding dehydrogenase [Patulibacter minatonensis]
MPSTTAVVVREHGGPENLLLEEVATPDPGTGEVLVAVEAVGVAYADVLMRQGLYPETPKLPFTPGYDLVGRVVAAGPGTTAPAVGSRVAALTVSGSSATHAVAKAAWAVPIPDDVDAASASALVLNYVTAHQMLHRVAAVPEGGTVLVLGAAGGVGTALLELCALAGIRAIGTASGDRTALVEARGGIPVDRRAEDVEAAVRRHAPDGVDATFDAVGGPQLAASRRMTRRDGTVVSYGVGFGAGKGFGRIGLLGRHGAALAKAKLTRGAAVPMYVIAGRTGAADKDPAALREDLAALVALVADGSLTPEVTTLPLAEIAEAHRRLESQTVPGKLVLLVDQDG